MDDVVVSRDDRFMARALELARTAPFTSPNPRVGAVVVRGSEVVSEGFHRGAGTAHAEAAALEGVDAAGATLYVNLEPCSHTGRTAPCAPLVAASGVARVVAANGDPDPRVSGAGFEVLRAQGVEVTTGVLEPEGEWLNAAYFHHRRTGRAYVSLKLAMTLDGRLGAPDRSSRWVTGEAARRLTHRRRLEVEAVLVGSGTVALDDPSLTVRAVDAPRQPLIVVVDSSGSVAPTATLFGGPADVVVATHPSVPHEAQTAWKEAGAEVLTIPAPPLETGVDLDALIAELGRRGIVEVLCEGGGRLATELLRRDLVDRFELHHGAATIGGDGPGIGDLGARTMSDARRWKLMETQVLDDDVITVYRRAS
ncbi:MAG TPA: bifunctional diaminohydroxyphosphoribosylaminopyrimidine deaminase/5-amino-6-(5-phosphoribosylamino)uracil reductase RibD [Actinomycetota bacterium]|nr:bifunctional diaminohydroxyphosphoribosylaminopyrimidine deaminase/5-amino-6-(5-phosphoribosylamino)uracil reductase RibD [Actinomycetota bacterium]